MSRVAEALLAELDERGIRVRADGTTLRLSPLGSVDEELRERVIAAKPYLLAALANRRPVPTGRHACDRCGRFLLNRPTTCYWCLTTPVAHA